MLRGSKDDTSHTAGSVVSTLNTRSPFIKSLIVECCNSTENESTKDFEALITKEKVRGTEVLYSLEKLGDYRRKILGIVTCKDDNASIYLDIANSQSTDVCESSVYEIGLGDCLKVPTNLSRGGDFQGIFTKNSRHEVKSQRRIGIDFNNPMM